MIQLDLITFLTFGVWNICDGCSLEESLTLEMVLIVFLFFGMKENIGEQEEISVLIALSIFG